MELTENPLLSYYQISKTLIPIIEEAIKREIVIKDLITKGNTLYDEAEKCVSIIDLDGMQVKGFTDGDIIDTIYYSHIYGTILCSQKYTNEIDCRLWTTEFNIFLFYELFLKTVFNQSLLKRKATSSIRDILTDCGIPKESNLFGRIMDLTNLSAKNSIDIHDFEELAELPFDKSRKRIIH